MVFVALLVVVLLTGRFPFELPSWTMLAALAVAVVSFSLESLDAVRGRTAPG